MKEEGENTEEGDELDVPIKSTNDILDMELNEMRRGIKYELFHYVNSIIFHMAITWVIINLTRTDQVLH
jgi:hypothetical protein